MWKSASFKCVCMTVCVCGRASSWHPVLWCSGGFPPNTNCLMREWKATGGGGGCAYKCVYVHFVFCVGGACVCVIKDQCQQGGPVLERVTRASSRPSPTFGHYLPTLPINASECVCVCVFTLLYMCVYVKRPATKLLYINNMFYSLCLCHFHLPYSLALKVLPSNAS